MKPSDKTTILLVDDDPAILLTVGDLLEFEGFHVLRASSAEQGLSQLKEKQPHLIVLDIAMPGKSGVSFLLETIGGDGHPRYPVIVFTARSNMADFFANIEIAGFLAKPCEPDHFLSEVRRVLIASQTGQPNGQANRSPARRKVLVAEDDNELASLIVQHLQQNGFEVLRTTNGPEALQTVLVQRPEVVVLRFFLSGMNGNTVAAMLHDILGRTMPPVIVYDDSGIHTTPQNYPGVRMLLKNSLPTEIQCAVASVAQERDTRSHQGSRPA